MDTTFPTSLPKFQRVFPDDDAGARYWEAIRWPDGFSCPKCGLIGEPYRFATRSSVVLRCRACKKNTSLTAGTVMQSSHMPLSTWFWGAYLMTTQTPGQSAIQFQRQLDIATYETAFAMLHKLRAGMVRPDRDTIGKPHPVEIDECFIGGRARGEGKGTHHQTTVVGAVEVRTRKDAEARGAKAREVHEGGVPVKKLTYAGRLRLRVVSSLEQSETPLSGRDIDTLTAFVMDNVTPGSMSAPMAGKDITTLPKWAIGTTRSRWEATQRRRRSTCRIHLVFSNLKTWINGT